MDWLDLLAVQGTLKSLLQHHSSTASILQHSTFFTVQLSHPYMTAGKTIALTRRTLGGKAMSLPTMWETQVQSLSQEDILEKEMTTQASILAWKIPWTEEPGRLEVHGVSESQT